MRMPVQVAAEIERLSRLILKDELSYDEADDALEVLIMKEEHRLLVRDLVRRWARNQVKAWMSKHLAIAAEDEDSGQQTLPFTNIPARLEVSPGRFVHQKVMTKKDWLDAARQAKTKADNAAGFYERVQAACDMAITLLQGSDELTLADLD